MHEQHALLHSLEANISRAAKKKFRVLRYLLLSYCSAARGQLHLALNQILVHSHCAIRKAHQAPWRLIQLLLRQICSPAGLQGGMPGQRCLKLTLTQESVLCWISRCGYNTDKPSDAPENGNSTTDLLIFSLGFNNHHYHQFDSTLDINRFLS